MLTCDICDVQYAIADDAACGGKGRGKQDNVCGIGIACGQKFGGDISSAGGVDFFEEEGVGAGGEVADSEFYGVDGCLRREVTTGGVADPDGLRGVGIRVFGEPDAGGVASAAEESGGAVACACQVIGKEQNPWGAQGMSSAQRRSIY